LKKKFFTNLIFLVSLNLIVKPFWVLGIDRTVQNTVGTDVFGIYFGLFNLSILFNIILDFGLTNFNNRNIAQHKQHLDKYFSNIVVFKLMLTLVYAVITIAAGLIAKYNWYEFRILFLLIANQILLSFILYLRSNVSGLQIFKVDSLISVLDRFLMIVIVGGLLLFKKDSFKIEWFVFAQTIAYLVTALVAFFVVLYHSKFFKPRLDKPFLFLLIKKSFPYALLVFFMSIHNRIDAVLLNGLLPDGNVHAGIYAQSFRLLDAVSQFAFLFASLLLPIFSKSIKLKEDISELTVFSMFLILSASIIFVIPSIFYNSEIISILYPEHNSFSSEVFSVLIVSIIPISMGYIYGTLLTANGSIKQLNIIAFIGVLINVILNLILIPKLQSKGTAFTALVTQSFTALAQFILAVYLFKIKFSGLKIISVVAFVVSFYGIVYFIHNMNYNWILSYCVSLLIGLVLAFVLRLLSLKTILMLIKGKED